MSIGSHDLKCPKCGGVIPPEAPQGLCPNCLLAEVSIPTEAGPAPRQLLPAREQLAAAFPHLEILELIGQGGMGFVFKSRQPKLDRFVALKILSQSLAADLAFADRFTREGRVLARLNHPNIVTIHDFGQANGFFYLLMEFVDGVNLRQAMRLGRFTPEQALAVVPKICEALQYAHNEGVLHRDIKPENILLDTRGRVKIADFGIAKIVGEAGLDPHLTASGATLGTPHYMAPEQVEQPGSVDHRADIYSLGVVFYEMLTGELPLGRFAPPSEKAASDPRLDDVVLRTLEKEPGRRTQSADEVKTQLETIATHPAGKGATLSGTARGATSSKPPRLGVANDASGGAGRTFATRRVNPWPTRIFWLIVALICMPVFLIAAYFLTFTSFKPRAQPPKLNVAPTRVSVARVETLDNFVVLEIVCNASWEKFQMRPVLEGRALDATLRRQIPAGRDYQLIFPTPAGATPAEDYTWRAVGRSHRWRIGFALPDDSWAQEARAQLEAGAATLKLTGTGQIQGVDLFKVARPRGESYHASLEFEPMHRFVLMPADVTTPETRAAVIDAGKTIASGQEMPPGRNPAPTIAELPPVVVTTQPMSGARDVRPGRAEIRVRFSKPMLNRSWSWSTAWEDSAPKMIGQPQFESDGRTCVVTVDLEPERTYAFWINSEKFRSFTDQSGRPAVPYLLIFQTAGN